MSRISKLYYNHNLNQNIKNRQNTANQIEIYHTNKQVIKSNDCIKFDSIRTKKGSIIKLNDQDIIVEAGNYKIEIEMSDISEIKEMLLSICNSNNEYKRVLLKIDKVNNHSEMINVTIKKKEIFRFKCILEDEMEFKLNKIIITKV